MMQPVKLSTLGRMLVFAILLWPTQARAVEDFVNFMSANRLYELCGQAQDSSRTYTTQEVSDLAYCNAYIAGVTDEAVEALSGVHPPLFCLKSVTVRQIHDVVLIWLKNHPEERHLGAQRSVIFALAEAFSCK